MIHSPFVLSGGRVVTSEGTLNADISVADGKILSVGATSPGAGERISIAGLTVLPGVIDSQVHFREPGMEHKEDIESGTRAAALGGVTAVFEMPNTSPPTTTREALEDKFNRACGRAWTDHAFFVGATPENTSRLAELESLPGCAGIKTFMGSSTGTLLVANDSDLRAVLASGTRPVAVHAEDEERLSKRKAEVDTSAGVVSHPEVRDVETALLATRRILALAEEMRRRIHILHISTGDEVPLLAEAKGIATAETTPQHLTIVAPECYEKLGSLAQMNPPIRDESHQKALWKGIQSGAIDVIGSDHAPHSLSEKARPYPESPSGMPGTQTLLPIMLDHVHRGRLSLERLAELVSVAPARIYGARTKGTIRQGNDADFTIVDTNKKRVITNDWIATKAGWTPFDGYEVRGWPVMTVVRGQFVMREDEILGEPIGAPIEFSTADT